MTRRKRLLALAFAAMVLLFLEGLARLVPEPVPEARGIVLVPHPTRGWTLAPPQGGLDARGPYQLDDDGMRLPARPGPADAPRVLTTGDSSIFGDGLSDGEALHDALARELDHAGISADVATVAVPGYSTLQTAAVLDELGWAREPALLVIGNLWSDGNLDVFRDADLLAALSSPWARAERILGNSALFRQLRRVLNLALGRSAFTRVTWPRPGMAGVRRVPLADYAKALDTLLAEARERGVGALVLGLADREMIERGLEDDHLFAPYVAAQRAVAGSRGVPWVEGGAAYRASARPWDELLRGDGLHPTRAGIGELARAVADRLAAEGWPGNRLIPGEAASLDLPDDPRATGHNPVQHSVQLDILGGGERPAPR
jgi:hypothetical protein